MHRNHPKSIEYDCYFRDVIDRHNVNVAALSRHIGVSRNTMYKYINGEIIPKSNRMIKIANFIGCEVDDIWIW